MVRDSDAAASWAPPAVAVVPILGSVTVWPASSMSACSATSASPR